MPLSPIIGIPPHHLDAEESLLCAILLDNRALLEVVEVLSPDDFYLDGHRLVYSAQLDLYAKEVPIDAVTVADALKRTRSETVVDTDAVLQKLTLQVPTAVDIPGYAKKIADAACLRRLIREAGHLASRCYEDTDTVDTIMDDAETVVQLLKDRGATPDFSPLGDLVSINIDQLEQRALNRGVVTGVPSGLQGLDAVTGGWQPSDLIILAARPGMGKTSLALTVAVHAAVDGGIPVALFSLEMSKEQLGLRILSLLSGVDSAKMRTGMLSRSDWEAIVEAAGRLDDAPLFIDDAGEATAVSVRSKVRRLKREHPDLGLVIVDYLQLMHSATRYERRDLEISDFSRGLKRLAKELSVPVMALSQLNRRLEERADKRPMLSDLRESGALEQDADMVVFIYRDDAYNKDEHNPNRGLAELIVAKHRNGPVGTARAAFTDTCTRFADTADASVTV